MYLIKFGGSVITEKSDENPFFKESLMNELSRMLYSAGRDYVLVHGAGSFGHVSAKKYRLNRGLHNEEQKIGFGVTLSLVQQLNTYVLQTLQKNNLPAISIPPHATFMLDNHKNINFNVTLFQHYLKKGFIPVTYGDVILDKTLGISICSGDLLIQLLAERLQPEKIIFVIDEDGLFEDNPKKNPKAKFIHHITSTELQNFSTLHDDYADVTGGMLGKIKTVLEIVKHNIDVLFLNGNKPDRLYDALTGKETTYTLIQR